MNAQTETVIDSFKTMRKEALAELHTHIAQMKAFSNAFEALHYANNDDIDDLLGMMERSIERVRMDVETARRAHNTLTAS